MKPLPLLVAASLCNYGLVVGGMLFFRPATPLTTPKPETQIEQLPRPAPNGSRPNGKRIEPKNTTTQQMENRQAPQVTNPPVQGEPTSAPKAEPGCLVVINSVSYDLAAFRSLHGGGDIFQCNTDMSAIFAGQHPSSYLQQIEKFKL